MLVPIQFCSTKDAMSRWGEEKTLLFINLYRQRDCLWNTRSPLYKNKRARELGYRSILQTFNDKYLDLKSVKTKIKNLRSVYHTELKKVRHSQHIMNHGRDGQVYRPSLSWFEAMHDFLGDVAEDRGESEVLAIEVGQLRSLSTGESGLKQEAVEKVQSVQAEESLEPYLDHRVTEDPLKDTNTEVTNDVINLQSSPPKTSIYSRQSVRAPNMRKITRRKKTHESIYNTLQRLESGLSHVTDTIKQQQQNVKIHQEDEFHIFALSVAAQLRQLPLHLAITTQNQIQNTLSESRLASIFSNNSSPPASKVKDENEPDLA